MRKIISVTVSTVAKLIRQIFMKLQSFYPSILYACNFYLVVSQTNVEDDYVKFYGNNPENLKGLWPEVREMEANGTLADYCSRVHYNNRSFYEAIDEIFVKDGHIHFVTKPYKPMAINLVRYRSDEEKQYYYLTKGQREDFVYYLDPIDSIETQYRLLRHQHVFLNH